MAEPKTRRNDASVTAFLDAIDEPGVREDVGKLDGMMRAATNERPQMWGPSIVGYGSYRYEYDSGRRGEWMLVGFSPRKQNLVVYIMPGFESFAELMAKLGKYKTGKSCLYIKRLADVDEALLERLIRESVTRMRERYPAA